MRGKVCAGSYLIRAICLLLFFVLLIGRKYKKGIWFRRISIFWFRFAMIYSFYYYSFSILLLWNGIDYYL